MEKHSNCLRDIYSLCKKGTKQADNEAADMFHYAWNGGDENFQMSLAYSIDLDKVRPYVKNYIFNLVRRYECRIPGVSALMERIKEDRA